MLWVFCSGAQKEKNVPMNTSFPYIIMNESLNITTDLIYRRNVKHGSKNVVVISVFMFKVSESQPDYMWDIDWKFRLPITLS